MAGVWCSRALRRLGLRLPVRVEDSSTAAGGRTNSAQLIGVDVHGRRELLLRPAVACAVWVPSKKSLIQENLHCLQAHVTRRGYCSKRGDEFWTREFRKYRRKVIKSMDQCLWSIGYRPSRRFRPFLLLLTFGLTSQSAGEVKACVVAQGTAKAVALLSANGEELMEGLKKFVKTAEKVVVADEFGWGP